MTSASRAKGLLATAFAVLALSSGSSAQVPPPRPARPVAVPDSAVVLRNRGESSVKRANQIRATRGDSVARDSLEAALKSCGGGPKGAECRAIVTSGLGSLLQRQAAGGGPRADTLTQEALRYYERALLESPNHPAALYGKALAYRALGTGEGEGSFYAQAAERDTARRGVYRAFEGDYYAANRRWSEAVVAFRRALNADQDDEGAQSGLIEALTAQGREASAQLLGLGRDWELRSPASAARAYSAVLAGAFSASNRGDARADSAILGLISVQARTGRRLGEVPGVVPAEWVPMRELRSFLDNPISATVPWWSQTPERRRVLALAALAQGRQMSNEGNYGAAERIWASAAKEMQPTSSASLNLQRELAVLYFQRPALDPDGRKFATLEHQIFEGKSGALATGDLKAAQQYHTTLGLIYAEREVWESENYARNATRQLNWALEKAEERERREGFYQPLPELRQLLASRPGPGAARRYAAAAKAYLDADDLVAAKAASESSGLPNDVLILRAQIAGGGKDAIGACTRPRLATLQALSDRRFGVRQRFKALADCLTIQNVGDRRRLAIDAFRLLDTTQTTLVGMADVARLERVVNALLEPGDEAYRAGHLEATAAKGQLSIPVALPGEAAPLWLNLRPSIREQLRQQVRVGRIESDR